MALDTGTAGPLTTEDTSRLVVQPVMDQSVAVRASTSQTTASTTFRIPRVTGDASAGWVAEGAEIVAADPTLDEIIATPAKVAGLTVISRELAADSTPGAAATVGASLARDISRQIDAAYFGSLASPAPAGLEALTGVQVIEDTSVSPAVPYSLVNLDHFASAISLAEQEGAQTTNFVTTPTLAEALSKLKTGSGSNEPLLGRDATQAGDRRVLGVPTIPSPHVAADTVWAIPSAFAWVVIRDDVTLERDASAFFTSDRIAVKSTLRATFAYPHPASIVKIRVTP